ALAYAQGLGVSKNDLAAVDWLQRAVAGGHADAARRLARAYREGELGLPRDPRQAQQWEDKARPTRF
ncbi:MAG: SEL1-like repeat protein, partial [Candidatus Competibacter sp.]